LRTPCCLASPSSPRKSRSGGVIDEAMMTAERKLQFWQ